MAYSPKRLGFFQGHEERPLTWAFARRVALGSLIHRLLEEGVGPFAGLPPDPPSVREPDAAERTLLAVDDTVRDLPVPATR